MDYFIVIFIVRFNFKAICGVIFASNHICGKSDLNRDPLLILDQKAVNLDIQLQRPIVWKLYSLKLTKLRSHDYNGLCRACLVGLFNYVCVKTNPLNKGNGHWSKRVVFNIQVMQHCNRGKMQHFATFLFQFAAFIRLKPSKFTMKAMARREFQWAYQ